jgi:hypothetical protein
LIVPTFGIGLLVPWLPLRLVGLWFVYPIAWRAGSRCATAGRCRSDSVSIHQDRVALA